MNVLSKTPKKMDATVMIVRRRLRQIFRQANFKFVRITLWIDGLNYRRIEKLRIKLLLSFHDFLI